MPPRKLSGRVTKEMQAFLLANEHTDEHELILKHRDILGISSSTMADQIAGRRKAKAKLPAFYQNLEIVYPPSVNLEQTSSEFTAEFKAKVIQETLLNAGTDTASMCIADLTGGFGVDSFLVSKVCDQLDYVEPNVPLLEIAKHNHHVLQATNIRHHPLTALEFLRTTEQKFNFAIIDPSRRNNSKKVFRLADCEPDVVQLLPLIFEKAERVLIKASPLLDLQQGLAELKKVEKIFIVAVDDECKEVLFSCSKIPADNPAIIAINLSSAQEGRLQTAEFHFTLAEERSARSELSDPLTYLYEPHPWILKAGAFKLAGARYGLSKLNVNTHLYTSDECIKGFPGRVFRIEAINPDSQQLKAIFPEQKANVFVRNYPLRPEELRKKLKLHDGGDKYLIGFSGMRNKFLVAATKKQVVGNSE